jgi:hypothetical protein
VLTFERITGEGTRDTVNQPVIVSVSAHGTAVSIRQEAGFLSTGEFSISV